MGRRDLEKRYIVVRINKGTNYAEKNRSQHKNNRLFCAKLIRVITLEEIVRLAGEKNNENRIK